MFEKYVEAQRKYCKEIGAPMFIPTSGECFRCGGNIFEDTKRTHETWGHEYISKGISLEKAGSQLITGCPHCDQTFCD